MDMNQLLALARDTYGDFESFSGFLYLEAVEELPKIQAAADPAEAAAVFLRACHKRFVIEELVGGSNRRRWRRLKEDGRET